MAEEFDGSKDAILKKNSKEYFSLLSKIRVNIANYNRRFDIKDWIREAYYYAEKTRNRAIELHNAGQVINKVQRFANLPDHTSPRVYFTKKVVKSNLSINEIYALYYEWIKEIQTYEERLRVLHGEAIPIPHSGGLAGHESKKNNRHTREKHIPKYKNDLHDRLKREPKMRIVSRFLSEEIANSSIARTLEVNKDKILQWLENPTEQEVITYDFGKQPVGEILRRGNQVAIYGSKVKILLVYDGNSPQKYWVKTSYIEP